MAAPHQEWWTPIFNWITSNTIVFASFALAWKGIDKVFKFYSETRINELRSIVKEELANHTNPQIEKLSTSIDELRESIWALKTNK